MYIKISADSTVYPYTAEQLRTDNPNTSFPVLLPDELLREYGVFSVANTAPPPYSRVTQALTECPPELTEGGWRQVWQVSELPAHTQAQNALVENLNKAALRRVAYAEAADPLFFKWQRGVATKEEWLAKVQEIANTAQGGA